MDIALVTGASGAIGSATVTAFRSAGLGVVGVDLSPVAQVVCEAHVQADVLDELAMTNALKLASSLGTLRHVVHIAGGALPEEVTASTPLDISVEVFRASIELNLVSAWVLLRAAEPFLRVVAGNRSVTLCSSRNALSGHGIPPYSAAKAGLMGIVHPVAVQLGAFGIRVNAVAPGQIATPYAVSVHSSQPGHFERIAARSALGRLANESEVAQAFVACALTLTATAGQLIVVDAGGEVWRG